MSNALAIPEGPHDGYALVGAAGVWDTIPPQFAEALDAMGYLAELEVPEGETELTLGEEQQAALAKLIEFEQTPPYPYLQLLHSEHPPTEDRPAYLYRAALTNTPDKPFLPVDQQAEDDMLHLTAEMNRVLVEDTPVQHDPIVYDPARENNPPAPTQTVRALLYKAIQPIGFHPPVIKALQHFIRTTGTDWHAASLTNIAGIDNNFYHFETVVPAAEVTLTVGGEAHTTTVSALVAAGLRMALCETVRIARTALVLQALQENPKLLEEFRQAVLEGKSNPYRAALESSAQQIER